MADLSWKGYLRQYQWTVFPSILFPVASDPQGALGLYNKHWPHQSLLALSHTPWQSWLVVGGVTTAAMSLCLSIVPQEFSHVDIFSLQNLHCLCHKPCRDWWQALTQHNSSGFTWAWLLPLLDSRLGIILSGSGILSSALTSALAAQPVPKHPAMYPEGREWTMKA